MWLCFLRTLGFRAVHVKKSIDGKRVMQALSEGHVDFDVVAQKLLVPWQ